MLYVISLVALLVVLAGVIAYAGDVLGTTVGKRRLSLFGWRPRRTGQVVGVAVGILIMLTTLSILAVAFRGAAGVLLQAQRTSLELEGLRSERLALQSDLSTLRAQLAAGSEELAAARAELERADAALKEAEAGRDEALEAAINLTETTEELTTEVKDLQAQAQRLRERNGMLEAENTALIEQNNALQRDSELLSGSNEELTGNMIALNDQVRVLEGQVAELQAQVETQAQRVSQAQQGEAGGGAAPIYQRGEIVYSGVVGASEPAAVRGALASLVQEANSATFRRGAGTVTLSSDQVNGLIEAVAQTPGPDLVVLSSPSSQFGGEIRVEVTAVENQKLLDKGQLVASKQIHLGSAERPISQTDLLGALSGLYGDATTTLQRLGLFEGRRPELTTSEETFSALLSRLSGPVVVGLVATDAVYTSGPATLELAILY